MCTVMELCTVMCTVMESHWITGTVLYQSPHHLSTGLYCFSGCTAYSTVLSIALLLSLVPRRYTSLCLGAVFQLISTFAVIGF